MDRQTTSLFHFTDSSESSSEELLDIELPQAQVTPSQTTANGSVGNVRNSDQPTSCSVVEEDTSSSEEVNDHLEGHQYNPVSLPRFTRTTHALPQSLVNVTTNHWTGVHNSTQNYDWDHVEEVCIENRDVVEWVVFYFEEAPTTGQPHYHSLVVLRQRKRAHICIDMDPRAHWEKVNGTLKGMYNYIRKGNNKVFEWGVCPNNITAMLEREEAANRKRAAPTRAQQLWLETIQRAKRGDHSIRDEQLYARFRMYFDDILAAAHQDTVFDGDLQAKNLWIYGPPGTGKSRLVWDYVADKGLTIYVKNQNKWWDGYNGQKVVIIDDAGENMQKLAAHLKNWGDRYPFTAEVKGGTRRVNTADFHLIITSNYSIREIFNATDAEAIERRFDVLQMN